jgi:uncharacterized lipoprotein YajG
MKKYLILLTAVALLAVTGCSTLDNALLNKQTIPASTNAVTGAVTPEQAVYVTKPVIASTIATAQQYAPLIPAPYSFPVEAGLGILSAGLALYARSRNGKLNTANSVLQAVVTGVEAAAHSETKVAIQNAAVAAGVNDDLHAIVQDTTVAMK